MNDLHTLRNKVSTALELLENMTHGKEPVYQALQTATEAVKLWLDFDLYPESERIQRFDHAFNEYKEFLVKDYRDSL